MTKEGKGKVMALPSSSHYDDDYITGPLIEEGGFSSVFLATSRREPSRQVAVKKIVKEKGISSEVYLKEAKMLLAAQSHPSIVKLEACYDEKDEVCLVMEYVKEGDFYTYFMEPVPAQSATEENSLRWISEKECRRIIKEVLEVVKHLHDQDIVHGDLKLENLLLSTPLTNMTASHFLKLIDFGFASHVDGFNLTNFCGSLYYAAPEIYSRQPYGKPVDLWAIGVITYSLICKLYPFYSLNDNVLRKMVLEGKVDFPKSFWEDKTPELVDFIRGLLTLDPRERMTVEEALEHPWLHLDDISFGVAAGVIRAWQKWKKKAGIFNQPNEDEPSTRDSDVLIQQERGLMMKSPKLNSMLFSTASVNSRFEIVQKFLTKEERGSSNPQLGRYNSVKQVVSDINGVPCTIYATSQAEIIVYDLKALTKPQRKQINRDVEELDRLFEQHVFQSYYTEQVGEDEFYIVKSRTAKSHSLPQHPENSIFNELHKNSTEISKQVKNEPISKSNVIISEPDDASDANEKHDWCYCLAQLFRSRP